MRLRPLVLMLTPIMFTSCGPSTPPLSENQSTPLADMNASSDMSTPNNATTPSDDMGPSSNTALPMRCADLEDGKRCDGEVRFVCAGGQEVEREYCQLGCDAISGECLRDMEPPMAWCEGKADGAHCDGADLVQCAGGAEQSREPCSLGCEQNACKPDTFCQGKLDGLWCYADDLVDCQDDQIATREACAFGCESMALGTPDRCRQQSCSSFASQADCEVWDACTWFGCRDTCAPSTLSQDQVCNQMAGQCPPTPATASSNPPDEACNYMDWELSPDGWYLISRFGTTNDDTTIGRSTTCGFLQDQYDYRQCRYTLQTNSCLDSDYQIPWVQGHVDYEYQAVIQDASASTPGSSSHPEYYYVADAQRFGCGATLRVTNPANQRCVVVYAEDGGPGTRYEMADRGGRRILDSSPAVVEYLDIKRWGWASADMVYIEWGQPGDVPGTPCPPCAGVAASAGSEASRSPHDVDHMMPGFSCR